MKQVLAVNQTEITQVVDYFVQQLNLILPKDKCQRLRLHHIDSAVMYEQNGWLDYIAGRKMVELTITMAPSWAKLRTKLSSNRLTGWTPITVDHEIERLNMYRNQSHCINDRILRKYCLCHDIVVELPVRKMTTMPSKVRMIRI